MLIYLRVTIVKGNMGQRELGVDPFVIEGTLDF